MAELLLTVPEAANRLRLKPVTVQRQLQRGALRGIKRGRVWRVPESALLENSPPAIPVEKTPEERAAAILAEFDSGDNMRRNAAIIALCKADPQTREIVDRAAAQAVEDYDGPDDDFADLRALDGEPFFFPEEETP